MDLETPASGVIDAARLQSLSGMLRRCALRHRQRTAIVCGDVTWSYAELDRQVDRVAQGLLDHGLQPGDRVAVLARNSHAFVALRFAVARAGGVFVPINFMLNAPDVRYIIEHSGARMLFIDRSTQSLAGQALAGQTLAGLAVAVMGLADAEGRIPDGCTAWDALARTPASGPVAETRGGDDLLQIIYTSGTESRPKGALLSHASVLWQYQGCVIDCEWTASTIALHSLPLFHCAQLDAMLGPALQVGAINIILPRPEPELLLQAIAKFGVTSMFAPPTVWIGLLRTGRLADPAHGTLAKGYYGASIMPTEVLRELAGTMPGLRLWNLYGQTEIAPLATVLSPEEHAARPGSAGKPTLHVETRVIDDDGAELPAGQVGEIVHRSPQLLLGYWNDPVRTREAFADGWFRSGDLGWFDAEGYLTVVDRKKDMIKSGGENVASREVEEALYLHPAVSEAAVIGLPDPRWVEAVTAVVVLRNGCQASEQDIAEHCVRHLSSFKVPKRVLFREALPRNASGKILKRELRIALMD